MERDEKVRPGWENVPVLDPDRGMKVCIAWERIVLHIKPNSDKKLTDPVIAKYLKGHQYFGRMIIKEKIESADPPETQPKTRIRHCIVIPDRNERSINREHPLSLCSFSGQINFEKEGFTFYSAKIEIARVSPDSFASPLRSEA
jgi:hypothetical protein